MKAISAAILRTLANARPRRAMSATAIATGCAIERSAAASELAGLQAAGLVACAVRGTGWVLTRKGAAHAEAGQTT